MNILITGATGQVGRAVTQHLQRLSNHEHIYYAVRKPALTREELPAKSWQIRQFDFEDTFSFEAALENIDHLFLLRPPSLTDVDGKVVPLLKAAKKTGLKRIVYLSIQGVDSNKWTPHYKIEQAIKRSGIPYIMLRPGFFMQNLVGPMLEDIRDRDRIFVPAGKNRFNFVDVDEVGEVAARELLRPQIEQDTHTLVAGSPVDFYRVARMLSEVLGRKVKYRNPSLVYFALHKLWKGEAAIFVFVMIMLYRFTTIPAEERYTHRLQRLLQRPPKLLSTYIEENASAFQPEAGKQK